MAYNPEGREQSEWENVREEEDEQGFSLYCMDSGRASAVNCCQLLKECGTEEGEAPQRGDPFLNNFPFLLRLQRL